ncbi:cupin domain-containing protein [Pararhizobium sp. LjRoot238]|uniref:cupin domain-containing protein n=1 Tax=Pararhizobium sp. LjRoot238 TaxID=3342293 RepID=UPI003ED1359D
MSVYSLPEAWRSRILGNTAGANFKIIRMNEAGIPFESHADFDEAVLVIEGEMRLEIEGQLISMRSGDFYIIPAGKEHRVLQGSHRTLFLVDAE